MVRRKRRFQRKRDPLDYIALPKINLDPEIKRGIFVLLILALGAISFLSLFDLAGSWGTYLEKIIEFLFGWGKWIAPFILLALGFFLYNKDKYFVRGSTYMGLFIFIISFQSILHFFVERQEWENIVSLGGGGGYFGYLFASIFFKIIGFWGSAIALICLLLISLMVMFNAPLYRLIGSESWLARFFFHPIRFLFYKFFRRGENAEDGTMEDEKNGENGEETDEEDSYFAEDEDSAMGAEEDDDMGFTKHGLKEEASRGAAGEPEFMQMSFDEKGFAKKEDIKDKAWRPSHIKIDLPLDLLNGRIGKPTSGDIKNNMAIIQRTLENFGIAVEMGEVSVGPTVTQYTFKPQDGVKLSRITNLSNDLALALAAHPIRIEAPIPGKSLVGVEVPNQAKAIVGIKEILSDKEFKAKKSNLMIALGKDVSGKAWMYDLEKMPHLLVAGATNSGKSVCLNSVIVSLLYQNNPDDLKFIMVDPKRVELVNYNGIPHLLTPVITEISKTINALKWCLNEMDRRFEILSKSGKRNIISYNLAYRDTDKKLPYIIFVVDELADLMVAAARDIEGSVIRLAQMARAVGIHLVLATQRPSVDVITGLIKANMPARVAFSVASGTDSRTILDSLGAEKLLGRGDMLFITADLSKPKRLQGAFVSDSEIRKIVHYIVDKSGFTQYVKGVTERQKVRGIAGVGIDGASDDDDELLEEAKELIINSDKASASFLQRRLSIGYSRAARLLDILEDLGVVGPAQGAKPREILISKDQYDNMITQGVSGIALHNREELKAPERYLDDDNEEDIEEDKDIGEEEEDEKEPEDESPDLTKNKEGADEKTEKEENEEDESQLSKTKSGEDEEDEGKYFSR